MKIEIKRLSENLSDDYFWFFDHYAENHKEWGHDCYCCFFNAGSTEEWAHTTGEKNRAIAAKLIKSGELSGLLAYADAKPVGWCRFDDRARVPGIKVFYPEVLFDPECRLGVVLCFVVAQSCRGKGVATALLRRACAELKKEGFVTAEAYALTSSVGGQNADEQNYHGPLSMYLSQGFTVYRTAGEQTVLRKSL